MTEVIGFIAKALDAQDDVERIDGGYRVREPLGMTSLTFRAVSGGRAAPLSAVATVETRFTHGAVPDVDDDGIAWLNRRAVAGCFFRDAEGIGCRLTYSLYEQDPGALWVAIHLLAAFDRQLAFGFGVGQMEISRDYYHEARQALEVPRRWQQPLPEGAFGEIALTLWNLWQLVATAGPGRLVFEVPLAEGAKTRAVDPEAETALITIRTDVLHPLAGVGYCATLVLPRQPPPELLTMWCTLLNTLEHEQEEFSPRLGAWGKRGLATQIVYGMFWPVDQAGINPATNVAMWMAMRAMWIRKDLWTPGVGLHLRNGDV